MGRKARNQANGATAPAWAAALLEQVAQIGQRVAALEDRPVVAAVEEDPEAALRARLLGASPEEVVAWLGGFRVIAQELNDADAWRRCGEAELLADLVRGGAMPVSMAVELLEERALLAAGDLIALRPAPAREPTEQEREAARRRDLEQAEFVERRRAEMAEAAATARDRGEKTIGAWGAGKVSAQELR